MKHSLLLLFLLAAASRSQEMPAETWNVKRLIEHHLTTKKSLGVQDVYKMLHQAHFGVGHLLTDTAGVRSYLLSELSSMDSSIADEPLVERVSTDDSMVRINLRPFKEQGFDPEILLHAMFQSASETKPDTLLFRREWNMFVDLVRYRLLTFSVEDVQEFTKRIERGEIVPVHHSESYKEANRPAYRVALRRVFERLAQ